MYTIEKIIEVANTLQQNQPTGASTGERIAAAFVLNRPEYLPHSYTDIVDAWDRLEPEWQRTVRIIKRDYMHRLKGQSRPRGRVIPSPLSRKKPIKNPQLKEKVPLGNFLRYNKNQCGQLFNSLFFIGKTGSVTMTASD